jgi:hypothetical protein
MSTRRPEPSVEDLLDDPIMHALLARDGLTVADVRQFLDEMRQRLRPVHSKVARRAGFLPENASTVLVFAAASSPSPPALQVDAPAGPAAGENLRNQGLLKRVERIFHPVTNQSEAMPGGAQCQALGRRRSQRLQSAHVVRADDPQQAVVISCLTATASAEDLSKTLKGKTVP